jgi:hypothetical protein
MLSLSANPSTQASSCIQSYSYASNPGQQLHMGQCWLNKVQQYCLSGRHLRITIICRVCSFS